MDRGKTITEVTIEGAEADVHPASPVALLIKRVREQGGDVLFTPKPQEPRT
jgi:hypothetical protein